MTGSRVLVALRVGAPPERTFEAFTSEIGDGATMYELVAGAEGWPATDWITPWRPAR